MQKTAKPWAHLRSVLVYFAFLFKTQRIYSYIMQCECIFASGFSALSAPVRAFCTAPPARGRMQRQTPCTVSVSDLRTTFLRFAIKCVLFFSKVSKDGFFSHIFPIATEVQRSLCYNVVADILHTTLCSSHPTYSRAPSQKGVITMKKRLISLLLASAMTLSLLPVSAFADYTGVGYLP